MKALRMAVAALNKVRGKKPDETEAKEAAPPKSGDLSFKKPGSRNAVRYNPMTAPNTKIIDTRGVPYAVGPKGQLRRVRAKQTTPPRAEKIREKETKKGPGTEGEKV